MKKKNIVNEATKNWVSNEALRNLRNSGQFLYSSGKVFVVAEKFPGNYDHDYLYLLFVIIVGHAFIFCPLF